VAPNWTTEYDEILARVQTWPPEQRLLLAENLLRAFPQQRDADGLRGVPVERVRGVAAGPGSVPDNDTILRWVEEHLEEKYG
jgi:hypothetical protein